MGSSFARYVGSSLIAVVRARARDILITLTPLDRRQVGAILGQGHVEQRRQQRDIFGRVYPDRLERRLEIGEPPLDAHF